MKTDIYKVTIYRHDHYHQCYRFVGRVPTQEELIQAIEQRQGNSLLSRIVIDAQHSREIVRKIGIPGKVGALAGETWEVVGGEIGKVQVEHENAWTLEKGADE